MTRLRVEEVHKRFGRHRALRGVSLAASAEVVALVGGNGAGKSTLLAIIAGVLAADDGRVLLDGRVLSPHGGRARRGIGYVPEATDVLPHLTCGEITSLALALRGASAAAPELPELRDRLGVGPLWDQRLGSMSQGQRRRTMLLAGLAGAPSVLLLDEPDSGLSADGVDALVELLRERVDAGATILLATHDGELVERLGARRLRLADGAVVE